MTDPESENRTERETVPMEGPVFQVSTPANMPDLLFPEGEYPGAFQHATGRTIDDAGDDHADESNISLLDFDGTTEVPVADV